MTNKKEPPFCRFLPVLPILAKEAHEDVEYATNVVVLSTLSFVAVVPILMTVLQFIRSSDSALFFVEKNIVIFI